MNSMKAFVTWLRNTGKIRLKAQRLFRLYPALFILGGIICGAQHWLAALSAVLLLLPFFSRKQVAAFAAAAAIAVVSGLLSSYEPASSYLRLLDGRSAAADIVVRVSDTAYGGKKIPWLPPPIFFQGEITAVKLNGEVQFTPASGKIMVRAENATPFYGDYLLCKGVFREPRQESFHRVTEVYPDSAKPAGDGYGVIGFDYGNYLNSRGIQRVFYSSEFTKAEGKLGPLRQVYRLILRGRESTLKAVTSLMRDDENKGMIAALLFGCPQGVPRESRKNFIFSGTVHIFTVSGLHVGIVALLTGLILRGVPFRARYLIIPLVVLLYVLATGMNAPSVRAFTMITVWCACRAFLLKTPGLNLVFAAASILLLFRPGYLFDMGFQYSFITVGFLILSTGVVTRINDRIFERLRWIPPAYLGWRDRLLRRFGGGFCGTLCGCVTAWLAGSAVALVYQGIYVPFSVAANLLLMPLVWLLYPLALLAPLLSPAAYLMELILSLMRTICDFFYYCFESTPCARPPLWSVFVFFAALALMLGVRRKWVALGAAATVLLSVGFWHYLALSRPPAVLVMHGGGSNIPALAIAAPGGGEAVMINAPSYEAASAAAYLLRSRGVGRVNKLILTRGLKNHTGGTEKLLDSMIVDELVVPEHFSRREYLSKLIPVVSQKVGSRSINPKILTENQTNTIEYSYEGFIIRIDILSTGYGVSRLTLAADGYRPLHLELKNSSILEINEYEFRP